MTRNRWLKQMVLTKDIRDILDTDGLEVIVPESREQLLELSMGEYGTMVRDISYDVPGRGAVREATVTKCKNGLVVNYDDIYMRRRDPGSMVIADDLPTDKITHEERFGVAFDETRTATFQWLKEQPSLICMPFLAGGGSIQQGYPAILIAPANAAFFALGLMDLQGFIPAAEIPNFFKPRAVVFVAPPFRHTHYEGKQIVVHNRLFDLHEVFSFNLYPGPSAKKGIYAVLLDIGEQEKWVTLHASTVRIVTPYEMTYTIMHEGASGGGKSEMNEHFHRQSDGRLRLGMNLVTKEPYNISITDSSELHPVTDDMALCQPSLQNNSGKLVVADAEAGWFMRVNHITEYGTAPHMEKSTVHPPVPLLFFNMDAAPGSTCLIWEPVEDGPGKPCPNPRVIYPRTLSENCVNEAVEVDVRSFGIRQPPATRENPSYGIAGLFHVLPPALAWLWRLVAPRGFANPSISGAGTELVSEGVGSYWPFATGKMVDQANLLLTQILQTPKTRYVLIPNQHIGAYEVGFAGQWAAREYISRRGGIKFRPGILTDARCPLLGYALNSMKMDGIMIRRALLQVELQTEVGAEAYDKGAEFLSTFFKNELVKYITRGLDPLGVKIIEACLADAAVETYFDFIPYE